MTKVIQLMQSSPDEFQEQKSSTLHFLDECKEKSIVP
jgi:hypothetical protein